jgi:hypothetical protein
VGSQKFTKAPSQQGWFCIGGQFAADQSLPLDFHAPSVGNGVEIALILSADNAAGKGDVAAAFGTY